MILDIDPDRCTGCLNCTLYCSLAHEGQVYPGLSRILVFSDRDRKILIPVACLPCPEKACLATCPQPGAIRLDPRGAVIVQEELCTACGKCARACPIGAIHIHRIPGRGKNGKAVALKCDQCGGDPWCVRVCPSGAITRGEDPAEAQSVSERLQAARKSLLEQNL